LDVIQALLIRCSDEELEEVLAQFHNLAGQLPFFADRDIGALTLERAAGEVTSRSRSLVILRHALFRARWCAQAYTGPGEGLSRAQHLETLEAKIASLA
jgi:hypothetical protein